MTNVSSNSGISGVHRIIIPAIMVIALFGLLENAARIYEVRPYDPSSLYQQFGGDADHGNFLRIHRVFIRDPELFWKMSPNLTITSYDKWDNRMLTESTNSEGFRGKKEFIGKRGKTYRIATLGDSWTYGVRVEDNKTYPHQLSQLLRGSCKSYNPEVINLGCVGYSSYQGKVLARKYMEKLKPNLITICFGSNDSRRTTLLADKDQPVVSEWVIRMQRALSKSAFYNLLRNKILNLKKKTLYKMRSRSLTEGWPRRVSPDNYEKNLKDIISTGRKNNSRAIILCYLG